MTYGRYGLPRGEVWIAVVSVRKLEEMGCFYFSGGELLGPEMLDLGRGYEFGSGRHGVGWAEWLVMDQIPEDAVLETIAIEPCN